MYVCMYIYIYYVYIYMSPGGYASGGSSVCMYIVCMVTMDSVHALVKNIS